MSPTSALPPARPVARIAPRQAVYLASRFARRDEMQSVADELEKHGFEVTSRWLTSAAPLASEDLDSSGRGAELASMDLEDVRRATVCLAFTESPDERRPGRGGRHTELGIALALGLRVIVVGPREHVFHCLPSIEQFESWEDARSALLPTRRTIAA